MIIEYINSYDQFKEYISKYKYIIINISAKWCKPCKIIKPQIELFFSSIDEKDYIYLNINYPIVDDKIENFFNINKIPYFAFIKDGIIIDNFVSSNFDFVSKRLFDIIENEKEEEKKKYNNLIIDDNF